MRILTKLQMLDAERRSVELNTSLETLMASAGHALFCEIKDYAYKNSLCHCLVLVGNGNNGGDGLVAARELADAGISTAVLLLEKPKTEIAKKAFGNLPKDVRVLYFDKDDYEQEILSADIIADCVFGTGFHGELRENAKALFSAVSRSDAYKIACDLPSGVNCENGFAAEGTLRCDKTVCLHAVKLGCLLSPARELCGELTVKDIGIPDEVHFEREIRLFGEVEAKSALPYRPQNSHKGTFGRLLIVAGSASYPGAAAICTKAALRSGVGIVTLATVQGVAAAMAPVIPEATYMGLKAAEDGSLSIDNAEAIIKAAEKSSAVLLGCGLSKTPNTTALVERLLREIKGTVIVDADGINCLSENIDVLKDTKANVILTPHPAELARLCKKSVREALERRFDELSSLCGKYNVTVLSKSRESLCCHINRAYVIRAGNTALSKGGSGDMLAGIVSSLAAQGVEAAKACALGSYIMGKTAEELGKTASQRGIIAGDIIDALPGILKRLEQ